ncbi:ABC transporter permease [Spirochaetota bacterium]|nr:ABC transporter permease [Spirochaetota bacterium]
MVVLSFFLKRSYQFIIVMLVISFIGFSIQDALGDPIHQLVGESVGLAEREKLREKLGLNDPFLTQYVRFVKNALTGDLGTSYFFKKPVMAVILDRFPATLELTLAASFIVIFLSIPLGIYCAVYPKHVLARTIMTFSIIGISMPVFLTGILLIYIFPVQLGLLYSFGRGETLMLFGFWETNFLTQDGLLHIILPAISLASIMLPLFIRLIRGRMVEVLSEEYIHFAKARGLTKNRILYVHAFRNTLIPIVSVAGVQFATMIAYTILTETVFQWPGMGFMFIEAVTHSDIPLIVAYLVFVGFVFMVTNTVVDILYLMIDPTVQLVKQKF